MAWRHSIDAARNCIIVKLTGQIDDAACFALMAIYDDSRYRLGMNVLIDGMEVTSVATSRQAVLAMAERHAVYASILVGVKIALIGGEDLLGELRDIYRAQDGESSYEVQEFRTIAAASTWLDEWRSWPAT